MPSGRVHSRRDRVDPAAACRGRPAQAGGRGEQELQERGLLKHARTARAITAALRERGVDELTARLAAEVGMLAFGIALERWIAPDNDEPFAPQAAAALAELQARAVELSSGRRLSDHDKFSEPPAGARAAS